MRREVKNNKVLKAMAAGIAVMITLTSMPIDSFADEAGGASQDPGASANNTAQDIDGGIADAAQEAEEEASDAIESANEATDAVAAEASADSFSDDEFADDIKNVDDALDGFAQDKPFDGFDTDLTGVEAGLIAAEVSDLAGEDAALGALNAAEDAVKAANAAEGAMTAAAAAVKAQTDIVDNATDSATAKQAVASIKDIIDQVNEEIAAKQSAYDEAKKAYDEAVAKKDACEKAYQAAIDGTSKDADAAKAELDAAQESLDSLKAALDKASDDVSSYSNGLLDIASKQDKVKEIAEAYSNQKKPQSYWTACDELFSAIMVEYYAKNVIASGEDISNIGCKRIRGNDGDSQNYFEITYTDIDGTKITKYYNYLEDGTDGIKIFEKRANEVAVAKKNLKKDLLYTDAGTDSMDGFKYVGDTDTSKQYDSKSSFDEAVASGEVASFTEGKDGIAKDASYVDKKEAFKKGDEAKLGDVLAKAETSAYDEDGNLTETKVEDAETTFVKDSDGNILEQIKQDVTTITYTKNSFSSELSYDDEASAKAAAEALVSDNGYNADEDKELKIDIDAETTYSATATYVETFAKEINLSESSWGYDGILFVDDYDKEDGERDNLEKLSGKIASYEKGNLWVDENNNTHYIIESSKAVNTVNSDGSWISGAFNEEYTTTVKISITTAKVDVNNTPVALDDETLKSFGYAKPADPVYPDKEDSKYWKKHLFGKKTFNQDKYNEDCAKIDNNWKAADEASRTEAKNAAIAAAIETANSALESDLAYSNVKFDEKLGAVVVMKVAKSTKTSTSTASAADAKAQLDAELGKNVYKYGDVANAAITKYGFKASFQDFDSESSDTNDISQITYKKLQGIVEMNKNAQDEAKVFYDGGDHADESFKAAIDAAKTKKNELQSAYDDLSDKVADAESEVEKATAAVDELQKQISELKKNHDGKFNALEEKLDAAKLELSKAEDKLDELKDDQDKLEEELEDAEDKLDELIDAEENVEDDSEGGATDGGDGGAADDGAGDGTVTPAGGDIQPGLDAEVLGERREAPGIGNGRGNGRRAAEDGEVLGEKRELEADAVVEPENKKAAEDVKKITILEDPDTTDKLSSLVDTLDPNVKDAAPMSWWWLLIVTLLGATGYGMYRKHQANKAKKVAADTTSNKKDR